MPSCDVLQLRGENDRNTCGEKLAHKWAEESVATVTFTREPSRRHMHGVAKQGGEPNTPFEYLMELRCLTIVEKPWICTKCWELMWAL